MRVTRVLRPAPLVPKESLLTQRELLIVRTVLEERTPRVKLLTPYAKFVQRELQQAWRGQKNVTSAIQALLQSFLVQSDAKSAALVNLHKLLVALCVRNVSRGLLPARREQNLALCASQENIPMRRVCHSATTVLVVRCRVARERLHAPSAWLVKQRCPERKCVRNVLDHQEVE